MDKKTLEYAQEQLKQLRQPVFAEREHKENIEKVLKEQSKQEKQC